MKVEDLGALAATTRLFPLEGGGLVHHPSGWLLVLNAPAAFIWLCAAQGLDARAIEREIGEGFAVDAATAHEWFATALANFDGQRLVPRVEPVLQAAVEIAIPAHTETRSYGLLGSSVAISAPPLLWPQLNALLGTLPQASMPPAISVVVTPIGEDRFRLTSPHRSAEASALTAAAELEQIVLGELIPAAPHRMTFHAATLARDDRALLLVAPSGSGKTTLSVALAHSGWSYGSDELTLLGPNALWSGVPLPPCIKSENYANIARLDARLAEAPEQERFGRRVKFLPLPGAEVPRPVRNVYFPSYGKGRAAELQALSPLDGLAQLLGQCIQVASDFTAADAAMLVGWHENVRYQSLSFGDVADACRLLEVDWGAAR